MVATVLLLLVMTFVFALAHRRSQRSQGRGSRAERRAERNAVPLEQTGPSLPAGVHLEDYVHRGLLDLRIMLIQHARRG